MNINLYGMLFLGVICIILYLEILTLKKNSIKNTESFTITEDQIKQTVMNTVDQVYNMDTEAIRNLGAISKSILTGKNYHNMSGTVTPGNLAIPANTIIDGDTNITGDTTIDGNTTISGTLSNKKNGRNTLKFHDIDLELSRKRNEIYFLVYLHQNNFNTLINNPKNNLKIMGNATLCSDRKNLSAAHDRDEIVYTHDGTSDQGWGQAPAHPDSDCMNLYDMTNHGYTIKKTGKVNNNGLRNSWQMSLFSKNLFLKKNFIITCKFDNWDNSGDHIMIGVTGVTLGSDNTFGGQQYTFLRTSGTGLNHNQYNYDRQYIGTFSFYANNGTTRMHFPRKTIRNGLEDHAIRGSYTEFIPLYPKNDKTIIVTMLSIDGIIYYFNDYKLMFYYDFRQDPEYSANDDTFRFRIYVNIHDSNNGFVTLYPNNLDDIEFTIDSNNNLTAVKDKSNDTTNGTPLEYDMDEFSDIKNRYCI